MKRKRILPAVFLACGMMVFAASCGTSDESLVLYKEGAYQYKIVCSTQISAEEASAITEFTDLLEDKCGEAPTLEYDLSEDTEKTPEILIGRLERSESALPNLQERETYWCVKTVGEDIVINGSTSTALQMAMDYFLGLCSYDRENATFRVSGDLSEEHQMRGYYRDRWLLTDIPSYWGENNLNSFVYNCGSILTSTNPKEGSCLMQTVTSTTAEEAAAYAKLLTESGFKQISHSTKENNEFYRFTNDTCKVSVNYFANDGAADIILDQTSIATTDISYTYEPKTGERAEYYLYALNAIPYTDPNRDQGIQGGLSMVIKCADNSIIMIDGGDERQQMEAQQQAEFLEFLYEITGIPRGEKIRIAAWYITHGHGDHVNGFASFLMNHTENLSLERVIANIPAKEFVKTTDSIIANIKSAVQKYNCQEVKVHTGDVLQIADITMEILYTHEDLIATNGSWGSTESNDASVIAKLTTTDGMSLQVNGDMDESSCAVLEEHFTSVTLGSTLALIPHHLYNSIPESWYKAVSPQYFLAGQTAYNINTNSVTIAQAKLGNDNSKGLYCSSGIYGFAYENGRAVLIYGKQMY